jgi:hypothetical protein
MSTMADVLFEAELARVVRSASAQISTCGRAAGQLAEIDGVSKPGVSLALRELI